MTLPFLVFVFVTTTVFGAYLAAIHLPGYYKQRQMDRRFSEMFGPSTPATLPADSVVMRQAEGPLPGLDRMASQTRGGLWLSQLIEQSGRKTTVGAVIAVIIGVAMLAALVTVAFVRLPVAPVVAAAIAALLPIVWLMRQRSVRRRRFEEQFPEALDLLSRAIKAGHAFQTAMGMVADEMPAPVGPEFKKTFDQQNFGLPLPEALKAMTERMPMIDVRFFVTAVLIQRETGGNLSEILDNLAHVVRERFKVLRQVRVHTAHGRFTGYVLLALPASLAIVLSFINPEHMDLLFRKSMGQTMLMGAVVMQTIGFFWIKRVINIEV